MSYSKITFDATEPLNISNLNMLGSQYDEMVEDIENHNHDSDYYTKIISDSRFVHSNNDGESSGANADTIDGYTKAELLVSVPNDLIVWFYNETIPTGWHKTDGNGGTLNLLNKYIIGCDEDTFHDEGGNDVFSPDIDLTINEHILTVDEIPSHRHYNIYDIYMSFKSWDHYYIPPNVNPLNAPWEISHTVYTGYTGSDQGHSHTGSININNVDNRPKSKAIYLIQKVAT